MRNGPLLALISALAPFALAAGWLTGWALDPVPTPRQLPPAASYSLPSASPTIATTPPSAVRTSTPPPPAVRTAQSPVPPAVQRVAAFANCPEAYDAGRSHIPRGDPQYGEHLDGNVGGVDGIGCENPPWLTSSPEQPAPSATPEPTTTLPTSSPTTSPEPTPAQDPVTAPDLS